MPAMRDYQTDAEVLSKFVDVNKSLGEYYINVNKKNSPLAYIYDSDYQELQKVSPANRTRFEDELKALNSKLAVAAKREDVSQIVYSTYGGETWIRTINHDAAVTIEKTSPEEVGTVVTRDTRASLQLQADTVNEACADPGKAVRGGLSLHSLRRVSPRPANAARQGHQGQQRQPQRGGGTGHPAERLHRRLRPASAVQRRGGPAERAAGPAAPQGLLRQIQL